MPPESPTPKSESLSLHPIQLEFVAVRELTIRVKAPPSRTYELPEGSFELGGSISAFDEVSRRFQAAAAVVVGNPDLKDSSIPFYLRVELVGGFVAHDKAITPKQVMAWAQRGAQFTLVPYLREQVAALSSRAGFSPVLIPLIQIPTERVTVSSPSPEEIEFAKVRVLLQKRLSEVMKIAVDSSGLEDRGGGGRLEGPEGYISPVTLRGQKIRIYKSYRDEHGAEYRIEAIIGHTENWRATVSLFTDAGASKFLIVDRPDEFDEVVRQARVFFEGVLARDRRTLPVSHMWLIEWPDKTSLAATLDTTVADPNAESTVYWRGAIEKIPGGALLGRSTSIELLSYMQQIAATTGGKLHQLSPK